MRACLYIKCKGKKKKESVLECMRTVPGSPDGLAAAVKGTHCVRI